MNSEFKTREELEERIDDLSEADVMKYLERHGFRDNGMVTNYRGQAYFLFSDGKLEVMLGEKIRKVNSPPREYSEVHYLKD